LALVQLLSYKPSTTYYFQALLLQASFFSVCHDRRKPAASWQLKRRYGIHTVTWYPAAHIVTHGTQLHIQSHKVPNCT